MMKIQFRASALALLIMSLASAFSTIGISNHWSRLQHKIQSPASALSVFSNPFRGKAETAKKTPSIPDVVIRPDFRLSFIFLASGLTLDTIPYAQLTIGPLVTLLGLLFFVQTTRVRFVCDSTSFELKSGGDALNDSGENFIVGGENRWAYDSFVNWDFFPKGWIDQPQGPILVYFKETQTPSEKWNQGPGAAANNADAVARGAKLGQVHFFPAICDTKQLREEFIKRKCAKLD